MKKISSVSSESSAKKAYISAPGNKRKNRLLTYLCSKVFLIFWGRRWLHRSLEGSPAENIQLFPPLCSGYPFRDIGNALVSK
jgi:hypothetical protein